MLGDLPQDILGADPKYPPINNLDYLSVDTKNYDNYPSDNNSVRIQPKLADLWKTKGENTGIHLIPNQGTSSAPCPMGMRSGGDNQVVVDEIVREAKKAMMAGLKGTELAGHLRARYMPEAIVCAKDAMQKLSEEQGLLGNVYIDASAFSNAKEAESFLATHRNRLAQDIVMNESKVSPDVIGYLANKFHKNVVAEIFYDENLCKKYKAHLISAGKITRDFVIDSKETLRKAFLAKPVPQEKIVTASSKKKISKEVAMKEMVHRAENNQVAKQAAEDDFTFRRVYPILEFARENLSKGKTGNNLKEMLKGKYASIDLNDAARYLAVVLSSRVSSDDIDKLVQKGKVSKMIGNDLKKLAKEYPLKVDKYQQEMKSERQVGVQGYFHVLSGKKSSKLSEHVEEAVNSLRKGCALEQVKDQLLEKKLSNDDADSVLLRAVQDFNEVSAGVQANTFKPEPKKKVVADLPEKKTLPDVETIIPETQEYIDFFADASFDIEINDAPNTTPLEIEGLDHKTGLDAGL
jgi:hypothetical protein